MSLAGPSVRPYSPPLQILDVETPLQTHVSLEPLPLFAPTFGLAAILQRPLPVSETDIWSDFSSGRDESSHYRTVTKRPGRKVSIINRTLHMFTRSDPVHQTKPPKLENIRYRVMRTLKKTLRRVFERKAIKKKGLLEMNCQTEEFENRLTDFRRYARSHRDVLEDFSQLSNGPKVDQSRNPTSTPFSTYNNSYMEHVFRCAEVREIYQLFVQLIYSAPDSDSLSRRFSISCCRVPSHTDECAGCWTAFRKLLEEFLGTKTQEAC